MSSGSLLFQRSHRISERADSQGLVADRIATSSLTVAWLNTTRFHGTDSAH